MAFGEKKSFFTRLKEGLTKTKDEMVSKIEDVIFQRPAIDEDMLEELEEALILSDIGMDTTEKIIEQLRSDIKTEKLDTPEAVKAQIEKIISDLITKEEGMKLSDQYPLVILMIGVNGAGKTTSMGKIAHMLKEQGRSVMFAAGDTFRAAAIEQLEIWGERAGVPVIKHQEGADPSAVIYDAIQAAKARDIDVLICDTAGRLQNKRNLMNELEKMNKVIEREYPEASKETLLVLDAATGKNAISQAKEFGETAALTGIVLTKLDGTAKGGIVITLADQFDVPVKFIGVGEGMDDLQEFDPEAFAEALFGN
ncbi:MAG: signal recognition particle-docking protein FtsY [Anaerovoracaceae bacterium]|nr:signal recognition particle-docking protein FtsY [Bacillota bacterium]MDD7734209.1 signal recognition particle-docking protein FtsY [Bacillota bacterium]MDY5907149.1 signal recognition particle-docking protein FtsY [Anaerovoracaceae bacterium]